MRGWPALLILAAGCITTEDPPSPSTLPEVASDGTILHDNVATNIGLPIHVDHDHRAVEEHVGSHNLEFRVWSTLGVELGENGFANFVLHESGDDVLAFVAVDGDTQGGFVIADITDPGQVRVVGRYQAPGSGFQEVRVSPDGQWAFLNVQEIPSAGTLLADVGAGLGHCSVCIHVVDVRDPGSPVLVGLLPVETMGTHNMDIVEYEDGVYMFYVGQPATAQNLPPGNRLGVARLVTTPASVQLVPVGTFAHPALLDDGRSFPHDVLVQTHPDGRRIAYVSHWDGGLVTFDATNPLAVTALSQNVETAPSDALAIHWTYQEPSKRPDGRTIVWSAPEIASLVSGTGVIRSYDASDPASVRQLGTWQLPGDLEIPGQFLLSPHTAMPDQQRGLVAVAHYHAGVWVLDASDPERPRALGYALPLGDPANPYDGPIWWKKPNFDPDGFAPNVYQARWHEGLLWVTERGTGLYAYEYVGPVAGHL